MHIGLVGLGRMGANMRDRLRDRGVEVTGYDRDPAVSDVPDLAALVAALPDGGRVVWVMVPSGEPTRAVVAELGGLLAAGDLVVEGGNSHYTDDIAHAAAFLLDDRAGFVTGQVIYVCGGMTVGLAG